MEKMKILFQGDSITDGNRYKDKASRWDKNHQIGHSWAYIVTGALTCRHPGKYECVNRGVSGNTVMNLRERWQEDTLDERPDVLLVLVGVNDCSHIAAGEYTPEEYGKVYRELLNDARCASPHARFILLEPFQIVDDPARSALMPVLRQTVKEIAEETGALFIPLADDFDAFAARDGRDLWLWDGVHPTEAGHYHIAEKVLAMGAEIFGTDKEDA
ncbi:MAG: SGNH/GDSL hydrolase family protein [Clostridia bacterium]|nr:SGNH/GDSL hydrolase family protein [Clostridia bacterium]